MSYPPMGPNIPPNAWGYPYGQIGELYDPYLNDHLRNIAGTSRAPVFGWNVLPGGVVIENVAMYNLPQRMAAAQQQGTQYLLPPDDGIEVEQKPQQNSWNHTEQETVLPDHDTSENFRQGGDNWFRQGYFEEASAHYVAAIRCDPGNLRAYANYGAALIGLQQWRGAMTMSEAAISLDPTAFVPYNNIGLAYTALGKLTDAERVYKNNAVRYDRSSVTSRVNLATVLIHATRYEEALGILGQVVALKPDSYSTQNNAAIALSESGRYNDALAALKRAISLKPAMSAAYTNCSALYIRAGRFADALLFAEKALRRDPSNTIAQHNAHHAQQRMGQNSHPAAGSERSLKSGGYYHVISRLKIM